MTVMNMRLWLLPAMAIVYSQLALPQGKALVVQTQPQQVTVDYFPAPHATVSHVIDGRTYLDFPDAKVLTGNFDPETGLPVESFLVGIPPTGNPTVEVLNSNLTTKQNFHLCRSSGVKVSEGKANSVEETFVPVEISSSSATPLSSKPEAVISQIFTFRYQRVAVVEIRPYEFNASTEVLTTYSNLRLRITFPVVTPRADMPDPLFESSYRSLLVNYEQAKHWRIASRTGPPKASVPYGLVNVASRYEWFNPAQQYYKTKVATDGIFRITYGDIQQMGLIPESIDPRKIAIYYKGLSLSLHSVGGEDGQFNQGDVVEYYGNKLYDSPRFLNQYSDTSAYWLTIQGQNHPRAEVDSTVVSAPSVVADYFNAVYHSERDNIYYYGDQGLPNINQSAQLPGEGWYWNSIYAGQSLNFPFTLDNIYSTGALSFQVTLKVHSAVYNQATPNHLLEILVNGTSLGIDSLAGYGDQAITFSGPVNLLTQGSNLVTLSSRTTAASLNQVYVDWVEMKMPHRFTATNDSLMFATERIAPGSVASFQIDGFSNSNVSVYRLDTLGGIEKVFIGSILSNGTTYTVTFTDTIEQQKRYIAVTSSRKLPSPPFVPKTFTNLRSTSHGADYLVVSAPDFLTDANRLATYRAQKGIGRAMVVSVDDIYDEFGYGLFDPTAIRRFLLSSDSLWIPPKPSYVLFFGDADWDYKNNSGTTRRNFVPSLGNPVSDELYVASTTDQFLPTKFTGRIPCNSEAEASSIVDWIISYESTPLSLLNKRFLFMASGFDSVETIGFSQFCDNLISQYVTPSPIAGLPSRLYRTGSQVIQFEQTAESKQILDAGAVWITYFGHAGTDIWENGISEASQLQNNEGKRHVISDISCSTARFAEPTVDSFSEQLLFADAGGAIVYFGSSGFGFEAPLQVLANSLFDQFSIDSVREVGKLLLGAKVSLWSTGLGSVITQEALQQYTLIGDPALKIAVPLLPDYATNSDQFSSLPLFPSESDSSIRVSTLLSNFGLQAKDSVEVRVIHRYQGQTETILDRQLPAFGSLDTLTITSPSFSKGGLHDVTVNIDPGNKVAEVTKTNNNSEYSLFVNSGSILPIGPTSSESIHPDSVTLSVENPGSSQMQNWGLTIEFDTSSTFVSTNRIRIQNIPQGTVSTKARVPTGVLLDSTVYNWRGRFIGANDSTNWVGGYFVTNKLSKYSWIQDRNTLFAKNINSGLSVRNFLELDSHRSTIEAHSAGFNDGNNVLITLDNNNLTQAFANRGYNVAVINQYSGILETFGAFSIYSDAGDTTLSQPLINFLSNIPAGRRVIMAIWDEGAKGKSEVLNEAIEACGSALIRSLSFRASWAMIGWKGAPKGSVPEVLSPSGSGPVTLIDTLIFQSVNGSTVSPIIGPASKWNNLSVAVDTSAPGTHVSFDLFRSRIDGGTDSLTSIVPGSTTMSLINPATTTGIKLRANLRSDSLGFTPQFSKWSVSFDPPPELAVNYQTVSVSSDSIFEGAPITVHSQVYNVGLSPAESVLVTTSFINLVDGRTGVDSAMVPIIQPNSFVNLDQQFQTEGHIGTNSVVIQVDPRQAIPELYKSNNVFSLPVIVKSDTAHSTITISVDGSPVYDGDYVSTNPTIIVDVFSASLLPIADPKSIILTMDSQPVTLGASRDSMFESRSGPDKALVTYRPKLQKGEHTLSVQVLSTSGNFADTAARQVTFKVETEPGLLDVYNYPNPFAHQTQFTFNLVGSKVPDNLKIKIYSIAGRLIQELTVWSSDLRIGFNRVAWDGRDRDGDELANGVYFYKIAMSVDGKSQEVIQKLAIVK